MSSDNTVILVENLSKCYEMYSSPGDRLKQFLLPQVQRFIKRERRNYFQEFWALQEISFSIKNGETVGVIGANGSGKSTLLQIICGTLTPTSGTVERHGRIAALLELGSGFNPEFTGRENVYLNAAVLGLSKEEVEERFDSIADFADIGQFIEQPVKMYSSGMVVRLAFAVIAHVDPEILIIDEALSVGDTFFVQKCMRFLRKFMKTGTVLFVSHDTGAVVNLCSRAIWLEGGQVKIIGDPKDVAERYLASLHSVDGEHEPVEEIESPEDVGIEVSPVSYRDVRLDYINTTNLRNDIEVFKFDDSGHSFGTGSASITNVYLTDKKGERISWIVGGEEVKLTVTCVTSQQLYSPIIGFSVKDRLGQVLFGENTFITYRIKPVKIPAGSQCKACFVFYMPLLPVGDYSVNAAIAEGNQEDHVQLHWLHDVLTFKSHSSSVSNGLVGVPMKAISLSAVS